MAKQPTLMGPVGPELRSPVHDELLSMHAFLYRELYGTDVSEDQGCAVAVEITAIAAESLARTVATVRGGVDPESDELLSENIMSLLNQNEEDDLTFDIDRVFRGQDTVNDELVTRLADTAFAVSNAVYARARQSAAANATKVQMSQQLELAEISGGAEALNG